MNILPVTRYLYGSYDSDKINFYKVNFVQEANDTYYMLITVTRLSVVYYDSLPYCSRYTFSASLFRTREVIYDLNLKDQILMQSEIYRHAVDISDIPGYLRRYNTRDVSKKDNLHEPLFVYYHLKPEYRIK